MEVNSSEQVVVITDSLASKQTEKCKKDLIWSDTTLEMLTCVASERQIDNGCFGQTSLCLPPCHSGLWWEWGLERRI